MAFRTSRTSTVRGRPPRFAGGINGATSAHSASVRSLSYRSPRRSAAARCSGFHMRHLSPTQGPHKESQPIPETQLLSGWALSNIPVVYVFSGDPVAAGWATSLASPNEGTTGTTWLSIDLNGKRIELLKEALPSLRRITLLANPLHPGEDM